MTRPSFPGGVSVTRLAVYGDEAPDGLCGGTPHLHTVSTEAYVVVGGTGALQTIDADGFRETPLAAGSVVWFSPGTVHRAVNHGGLDVLVVMSNAGLPEAGDAVMTFPDDVLADPDAYAHAATLPTGADEVALAAAASARRDLAVAGFTRLRSQVEGGDADALSALHVRAAALVAPRVDAWRELVEANVGVASDATRASLDALGAGAVATLALAAVAEQAPSTGPARFGMCGRLRTYDLAFR